jgi:hypothetical protein
MVHVAWSFLQYGGTAEFNAVARFKFVFCRCLFLWLTQPYVPHMHPTPGLNDSAHLPNIHSSALTWDAVHPNNAVWRAC